MSKSASAPTETTAAEPLKDDSVTQLARMHRVPQYSKNGWEALKNGPSKRDTIAQRKRDQLALEKLVREAKFGPEAPLVDETTKSQTLSSRSLSAVAEYILSGKAKKIVVLAGAGMSTSAGIPDFRSKGGFYDRVADLKLPYPEAMFELDFFRGNPRPFYVRAKEMYLGPFKPTISHAFLALLVKKQILSVLFTQNIDTLERRAGVPAEVIVEAHGTFATQSCIEDGCKEPCPSDLMRDAVEKEEPPHCLKCGVLVKPDIIFFGEQLPRRFNEKCEAIDKADLVIVMGSSLSVAPFSSLPSMAAEGAPRLLFNRERVGDLGTRPDDVVVLGDCDTNVRKLAEVLGWTDELEILWLESR
jgi:NAD-dependent histone deacetylase SIR2